jgi:hypothetical protein
MQQCDSTLVITCRRNKRRLYGPIYMYWHVAGKMCGELPMRYSSVFTMKRWMLRWSSIYTENVFCRKKRLV